MSYAIRIVINERLSFYIGKNDIEYNSWRRNMHRKPYEWKTLEEAKKYVYSYKVLHHHGYEIRIENFLTGELIERCSSVLTELRYYHSLVKIISDRYLQPFAMEAAIFAARRGYRLADIKAFVSYPSKERMELITDLNLNRGEKTFISNKRVGVILDNSTAMSIRLTLPEYMTFHNITDQFKSDVKYNVDSTNYLPLEN